MNDPRFDLNVMIRTTPRAKLALDRVVAALRASHHVRWKGKRPTQEAVFAAVWLWLEGMESKELEDKLAPQMVRLEAMMRGEPGPEPLLADDGAPSPDEANDVDTVIKEHRPDRDPRRKGRIG